MENAINIFEGNKVEIIQDENGNPYLKSIQQEWH